MVVNTPLIRFNKPGYFFGGGNVALGEWTLKNAHEKTKLHSSTAQLRNCKIEEVWTLHGVKIQIVDYHVLMPFSSCISMNRCGPTVGNRCGVGFA